MCSKILVIQHKFVDIHYYSYGYIGTDTNTDINIGAPLENLYQPCQCYLYKLKSTVNVPYVLLKALSPVCMKYTYSSR